MIKYVVYDKVEYTEKGYFSKTLLTDHFETQKRNSSLKMYRTTTIHCRLNKACVTRLVF